MTVKPWRCKMCGWSNPQDAKRCSSCNKGKPRAKKAALPRSSQPHQCILLGLDTANVTGWSIRVCGALVSHGQHSLYTDSGLQRTQALLDQLQALRLSTGLPIVAVSERTWGGRMGLGGTMAFGYWLHALRSIGVRMKRIIQVYPSTWRAVVLPSGMASAKREVVRPAEMQLALSMVNVDSLGEDEAPAVLIALWGECSGEVGASLL